MNARAPLTLDVTSRVHSYEWSDDNIRLAIGCDDGTLGIHTRGGKMLTVTVQNADPVMLVRWHPRSAVVVACLYAGDLQFFDVAGQALFIVGDNQRSIPTAIMTSHLDYMVRPVMAEWCRAKPGKDEPPPSADSLAVVFDRGPLAIVRVELPQMGSGAGAGLDAAGLVRQRIHAASSEMLKAPPGYGGVKTEMNAALTVLRCVKDKAVQGKGLGKFTSNQRLLVISGPTLTDCLCSQLRWWSGC